MGTNAGEPLISKRPFAVTKWLVSKQSPRLLGSKRSYTEICCIVLPHFLRRPLADSTHEKKTLGLQNPVPKTIGNRGAGMSGCHSYGEYNWWPVSRNQPLHTTV
jgi:hypothetical protein